MFSKKQTKKIDTSFLKYLTEDDLVTPEVTIEQVKKSYPHTKNNDLEALKLFYVLNHNYLDEDQRHQITNKIEILQHKEDEKFKIAFNTIICQQNQSESIQD